MSTLPLQKKADMITVPEDAIKAAIENYGDFIQNLVFDLSKYEDLLTQYIPALFEATQNPDPSVDNAFLKMAGFLFSESENMYMLKSTQFIRQAEELLNKKYTVIRTLIIKEGKENRFTFCENVFNIFSHHMVNIDWDRISINIWLPCWDVVITGNWVDILYFTTESFDSSIFLSCYGNVFYYYYFI